MKRIGDIAAKLIADPKRLVAAANEGPRKFTLDVQARMEAEANIERAPYVGGAMPAAREGTGGGNGKGKVGRATKPGPSVTLGGRKTRRDVTRLHLVVVNGKDRYTAAPHGRAPRPAVYLSLLLPPAAHG